MADEGDLKSPAKCLACGFESHCPHQRCRRACGHDKEKKKYRFRPGDSEGFVNQPLTVRSVRISALFTENFDGKYVRVSLRSKGSTDVNLLARKYVSRLYDHLCISL